MNRDVRQFIEGQGWQVTSVTSDGNTVVLLGDSITDLNISTIGNNIYAGCNGYFNWFQALTGHSFRLLNDAGVVGDTAQQMFERLQADVLAYNSAWVFVLGGVNDIYNYGLSASNSFAWLKAIYASLLDAGKRVVACTIPAIGSAWGKWSAAKCQQHLELNRLIRNEVDLWNVEQLVFCDMFAATVNPTNANADPKTNYSYDNVHPTNISAYAMGKAAGASVLQRYTPNPLALVASAADNYATNSDNRNHLSQGLFQGAAGGMGAGVSGVVASNWNAIRLTGTPTAVCSVNARADGFGNNQRMVITAGAAADRILLQTTDIKAGLGVNNTVWGECEAVLSSITNLNEFYIILGIVQGAATYTYCLAPSGSNDYALPEGCTLKLVTPRLVIPSGSITQVQFSIVAGFSGVGGATVDVGRAAARRL